VVVHARLVRPRPVVAAAVAEAALAVLGADGEAQVDVPQFSDSFRRFRLPRGHDETARDVVQAVAVVAPRCGEEGVLEETGRSAQARQVVERELGNHQATDRFLVSSTERPRTTYCSATAGHSSAAARVRAVAAIRGATSG
jgi:hypothetical protein